jgi:hypothetical protein
LKIQYLISYIEQFELAGFHSNSTLSRITTFGLRHLNLVDSTEQFSNVDQLLAEKYGPDEAYFARLFLQTDQLLPLSVIPPNHFL